MRGIYPPFLVKVCGVTTVEDGQVAVDAGANALGFNFFHLSPRFITPEDAAAVASDIHGEFLRVGIFVHPTFEQLRQAAKSVPLDVIQIHGNMPTRLPAGVRVWKAEIAAEGAQVLEERQVEAYLLDSPSQQFGGTGIPSDWKAAAAFPGRAILAGGLHAGNVIDAIQTVQPWGVDACSKLESSRGRKDANKVRDFVAAAWQGVRAITPSEILK